MIVYKFQNLQGVVGKPLKHDYRAKVVFLKQNLLIFGGSSNRYFSDIPMKIYWSPFFNIVCSFRSCQPNFSKANCFHVNRKLITWSTNVKGFWVEWKAPQDNQMQQDRLSSLLGDRSLIEENTNWMHGQNDEFTWHLDDSKHQM